MRVGVDWWEIVLDAVRSQQHDGDHRGSAKALETRVGGHQRVGTSRLFIPAWKVAPHTLAHWFPAWGVNYQNWVAGPFDFWFRLFFLLDQNRETGTGKTGPIAALINDNRRIEINDLIDCHLLLLTGCATEVDGHFCAKISLFVHDWGRGWGNDPVKILVTSQKKLRNTVVA